MVVVVDIPSEVLSVIHSAAASKLMDLDEMIIKVSEGKFSCYQRNAECSGMFLYESEVFEDIKDLNAEIPIFVKDIKTILSIVKEKANLTIMPGETLFKFDKLTKNYTTSKCWVPDKYPSSK